MASAVFLDSMLGDQILALPAGCECVAAKADPASPEMRSTSAARIRFVDPLADEWIVGFPLAQPSTPQYKSSPPALKFPDGGMAPRHVEAIADSSLAMVYVDGRVYWIDVSHRA